MMFFDVLIIGAGPAGCVAALRLTELGYRVALVERLAFPRPNVGESLSPGVWSIVDSLNVRYCLENEDFIRNLDAKISWDEPSERFVAAAERGPGIIVDRATMDSNLLNACRRAGVEVYQPAMVVKQYRGDFDWQVVIKSVNRDISISCGQIFNATGQARPNDLVYTSPRALVLWTDIPRTEYLPFATVIEALPNAWLWAAPVATGQYRIMLYLDTNVLKKTNKKDYFAGILQDSEYFAGRLPADFMLHSCMSQSAFNANSWQPQLWHIGDSAFNLDPLSSTGVEKSMRFALQACVCYHTIMRTQDVALAHEFYCSRLIQAVVAHAGWAQGYYAKSWQAKADDTDNFWQVRRQFYQDKRKVNEQAKSEYLQVLQTWSPPLQPLETQSVNHLHHDLQRKVTLSPQIEYIQLSCVVNDVLKRKTGIKHPGLITATAYIAEAEIAPLLALVSTSSRLSELLDDWSDLIGAAKAQQVLVALLEAGVIV